MEPWTTYLADLGKKALGDAGNPGDSEPCMGELQTKGTSF